MKPGSRPTAGAAFGRILGLSEPLVTIAIPTLAAGSALAECLAALEEQTFRDFEVAVIDNSGRNLAAEAAARWRGVNVIANSWNVGFGAAVNQVFGCSRARYLATLNDDTVPSPEWLGALVAAMEANPGAGMGASQIRLAGGVQLDSAGMLLSSDGSSKQRGHLGPANAFLKQEDVLLPSGCAALYRRKMLEEIGLFDEEFFLYCEDTDLGLRGRLAGWPCIYVPDALVEHRYSATAGAASPVKAYYVERNRLFVLLKTFPARLLIRSPGAAASRYLWHVFSALVGRGAAGAFRRQNAGVLEMAYIAVRAHLVLLKHAPRLLRQRGEIRRRARLTSADFERLLKRYYISPREVAAL